MTRRHRPDATDNGSSFELLLKLEKGAKLFDTQTGSFVRYDVGIRNGKIAQLDLGLQSENAKRVLWVPGNAYVAPGLIDLHGHWAGCSAWGIDPDRYGLRAGGASVLVDAGTTGRFNFEDFRRTRIDTADAQILAFLNIAGGGLTAPHHEFWDLEYTNADETAELARTHADIVVGIKVRLGWLQVRRQMWREVLKRALRAARAADLPLMVHIADGPPLADILDRLDTGDIVTHCFHGRTKNHRSTILDGRRKLRPEVARAVRRGVRFDVGHGGGSFNVETARAALDQQFVPYSVSTDLHRTCVDGPTFDLAHMISKMLALGVQREDVFRMVTVNPARAVRRERLYGRLAVGRPANITVLLSTTNGPYTFRDTETHTFMGDELLQKLWVIRDGVVF